MMDLAPAHLMDLDCRSCVRSPRTWPTKGGTRVFGQPLNRACRMFGKICVQKLIKPVRDLERRWIEMSRSGAKMPACLVVKYRDQFSFQGSRSLALLRLQRLI